MFYLIALLAFAVLVVAVPIILKMLAEASFLFTTVKEGTAKGIMRGDSFEHFSMSFADYHLNAPKGRGYRTDHPDWEVLYHGKDNPNGFTGEEQQDGYYDNRSRLLKYLGIYWIGWPWANRVYVYGFEWNETYTDSAGVEQVLPRTKATDFIYVADFTYAIKTSSAETNDRLPTDELTLVTVAIRNPYRALFSGEDWMRRITAAINRHARVFVGSKSYQQLISTDTATSQREFSDPIIKLSGRLPDDVDGQLPHGLQGRYGAQIRTADLQTVELSGDAKDATQKAATREYVAKQEAEATRLTGRAEADVIEMKGSTEAAALTARLAVITAHGDAGIALAGFDAMQEASKGAGTNIIWAGNPFGGLVDTLKSKTEGGKPS